MKRPFMGPNISQSLFLTISSIYLRSKVKYAMPRCIERKQLAPLCQKIYLRIKCYTLMPWRVWFRSKKRQSRQNKTSLEIDNQLSMRNQDKWLRVELYKTYLVPKSLKTPATATEVNQISSKPKQIKRNQRIKRPLVALLSVITIRKTGRRQRKKGKKKLKMKNKIDLLKKMQRHR